MTKGNKWKDHYTERAREEKWLARSVYKLEEIDRKYRFIRRGCRLLDLGCYPGSWSQYCINKVGKRGEVVGLDIKEPEQFFNDVARNTPSQFPGRRLQTCFNAKREASCEEHVKASASDILDAYPHSPFCRGDADQTDEPYVSCLRRVARVVPRARRAALSHGWHCRALASAWGHRAPPPAVPGGLPTLQDQV